MQKTDNNEGIVFSDDDDECEEDTNVSAEVTMRLQQNTESIVRTFKEFMSTPTFINNTGDPTTTIVDRYHSKCYNVPSRKIPKLFKFVEISRRKNLKQMLYEKQLEYSGIMLDFDIHLDHGGVSPICHTHYHRLCLAVMKLILKFVHFSDDEIGKEKEIHVGFTKKPKLVYDSKEDYYKDGFHMLIPGIQITRALKKYIISTLIEEQTLEKIFKELSPHKTNTRSQFLDINSSHVGVFFIGSASKINTPPYELSDVYKVQITPGEPDDIIPVRVPDFISNNTNICYEFSLNWEKDPDKGGIIKKSHYDVNSSFTDIVDRFNSKEKEFNEFDNEDEDKNYGELSTMNLHDPDIEYIKVLLDTLHPKRAEQYELWFDVLCALAHTCINYKPLGEYFSRKCLEKFDSASFERIWDSILRKKNCRLTMGSIHYWAKLDNPDRYEEIKHRSIFTLLYKKIYSPDVEGNLEHYDVTEILYQVLKNKYVYDKSDGVGTWYEFILEGEPMKDGEMYKWRAYYDRPNSLMRYISTILPSLFIKVLDRIKNTLDDCNTDLAKYHYQIYKNFQKSIRSLKNHGYKRSVLSECEQLFEQIGFSDKLDSDPNIIGVGNGILSLGKKIKLITGYHGHLVSKYTDANYLPYNPHVTITKKVLIALRNLFPDDEPDTFNYIMHYLASTLDGNKKESIMMLVVGKGSNGKSFLVELHKGAIGSIYGVKMPLSFLTSKSKDAESATPALMQLKDAHFAYYSESNKFEVLNMAKIKEFTGQETMAGRKLHRDYVNFKPKCHHLVCSNNDFEVHGTDHGTWRRLDYFTMKIKFCNKSTDSCDPKNPYERIADADMGSHWAEDPEVLAAYLGILSYYYESLQNNYGGKVRNVPHPHVVRETEEFRNRQDRINNFLNERLVKCVDEEYEMPISLVSTKYISWYDNKFPGTCKEYQRGLTDYLENSKLQSLIKKTRQGSFVIGYRLLDVNEVKDDDEDYYTDLFEKENKSIVNIKPESATELINRLCREFDNKKSEISDNYEYVESKHNESEYITEYRRDIKQNNIKSNNIESKEKNISESDSDIDEMLNSNEKRTPVKYTYKPSEPTNLDKNGLTIPKKKNNTLKRFAMVNTSDEEESEVETEYETE